MKTLKEEIQFNCSADELWSILSAVGRCDWVPTIEKITLELNLLLEQMIIKNPEQWIWTHNRWK